VTPSVIEKLRERRGSTPTIIALVVFTLLIIVGGITMMRRSNHVDDSLPQMSQQVETRAFYIAQTALDRSIKELVADPDWRDGFEETPFESGTYNVRVYDSAETETQDAVLPPNYVRIVASSEVEGVTRKVEAIWVDALSAFANTYSAHNHLELANHGARDVVVVGNIHNNAWNQGATIIAGGTRLYGNVTSIGDIHIGGDVSGAAKVYGSVWGSEITVAPEAQIHRYESLSEWTEGIDLNGDGDATDIGIDREPIEVVGSKAVWVRGRAMTDGSTDSSVGGGSVPVAVGRDGLGPIVDPRPDFAAYYEMVTGLSTYPPAIDHVSKHILGDGDGHYFSSANEFLNWIDFINESDVFCWRCAGDGRIDPGNTSECPTCSGNGNDRATVISGVFYIDDADVDLSDIGGNLIVHGTIVVAKGDPYTWPSKEIPAPGGNTEIAHFPEHGRFVVAGEKRMNLTVTYRSDEESSDYTWSQKTLLGGENAQIVPVPEPDRGHFMREYPAIIAADGIIIEPRQAGFAYHPGDIGDERLTVLQGVIYAENEVRLHGRGGWNGGDMVFDEMLPRGEEDALDEPVLNIDLNGDHDVFDRVELSAISTVPVVPVSDKEYTVDINNDGVLGKVTIGVNYLAFFDNNDYAYPTLIYHEGLVLGGSIHSCEQTLVVHDPALTASGIPFGFEVSFGSTTYQGLVWWSERSSD
jgi:hypothetical protein